MAVKPRSQRCIASSKRTGQRCRRWAILGGTVCPSHGGAAPQVQAAAAARLAALVHPAIDRLGQLLATADEAVALRAVGSVLDRTGYGTRYGVELDAHAAIELGVSLDHLTDEQLLQLVANDLTDHNHQEDTDATP